MRKLKELIGNSKDREYALKYKVLVSRDEESEGYYETHHIIPRCLGGGDGKENLVKLSPQDHLEAHFLLARMFPENNLLKHSFYCMSNTNNVVLTESMLILYAESKTLWSSKLKTLNSQRVWSADSRAKISLNNKGEGNPFYGKRHSNKSKALMSRYHKSKKLSASTKHKLAIKASDPTIYLFKNTEEEVFKGTRMELCKKYNLDRSSVTKLVKNKVKSVKGWQLC